MFEEVVAADCLGIALPKGQLYPRLLSLFSKMLEMVMEPM